MKNKIIIYLLIGYTQLVGLTSCSDFLKEKSVDQYDTENIFKSEELLKSAIVGNLNVLASIYRDELVVYFNCGTDIEYSESNRTNMDTYNLFAQDPVIASIWNKLFKGINDANIILDGIDESQVSSAVRNRVKSEALFLRSYYYFLGVRIFGNMPLRLHRTEEYTFDDPRVESAEIYRQIISDLRIVCEISALPLKKSISELARPSMAAAKGLLAKVLLQVISIKKAFDDGKFESTYYAADEFGNYFDNNNLFPPSEIGNMIEEAYALTSDLIDHRQTYDLEILPFYGDAFKDGNLESIMSVVYLEDVNYGAGWGKNQMGAYPDVATLGNFQDVAPYVNALVGFQPVLRATPSYFDAANTLWPSASNPLHWLDKSDVRICYFTEGDMRRDYVIFDGIVAKDAETGLFCKIDRTRRPMWGITKYRHGTLQDSFGKDRFPWRNGKDFHIMRFAEIYLMQAELEVYRHNYKEVCDNLNVLRNRARGEFYEKDKDNPEEKVIKLSESQTPDFPNYTEDIVRDMKAISSNSDMPDENYYLELVLRERGLELGFELQRWFDLVRTGRLYEKLDSSLGLSYTPRAGVNFNKTKHYVFPIPSLDLSVNTNDEGFKQNPNYN